MRQRIAILDYGMGNLHSVYRKLREGGADPVVTREHAQILGADKLVIPGVGAFDKAMQHLQTLGLVATLHELVLTRKKPVLGICLGMQVMAGHSEEGNAEGLGWIGADVVRFNIDNKVRYKVPQTGWNTIDICKSSALLHGIETGTAFYFLHAYHYAACEENAIRSTTTFEYEYVSAVEKENIFGTQFHPEKSHGAGEILFRNFIAL